MTALSNARRSRVLIVEDHAVVRAGLSRLLDAEAALQVVGEAPDAETALRDVGKIQPDLVVVDLGLPGAHGLDLIKRLSTESGDAAILVLSMHDDAIFAERALRAGARGYVNKRESTETLLSAIRRVLVGEVWLSQRASALVSKNLISRQRHGREHARGRHGEARHGAGGHGPPRPSFARRRGTRLRARRPRDHGERPDRRPHGDRAGRAGRRVHRRGRAGLPLEVGPPRRVAAPRERARPRAHRERARPRRDGAPRVDRRGDGGRDLQHHGERDRPLVERRRRGHLRLRPGRDDRRVGA